MKEKTIEEMLTEEEEQKARAEKYKDFSKFMNEPEKPEPFSNFMNQPVTEIPFSEIEKAEFDIASYAMSDCVDDIAHKDIDLVNAKFVGHCATKEAGEYVVYLVFELDDNTKWCLKLCRP